MSGLLATTTSGWPVMQEPRLDGDFISLLISALTGGPCTGPNGDEPTLLSGSLPDTGDPISENSASIENPSLMPPSNNRVARTVKDLGAAYLEELQPLQQLSEDLKCVTAEASERFGWKHFKATRSRSWRLRYMITEGNCFKLLVQSPNQRALPDSHQRGCHRAVYIWSVSAQRSIFRSLWNITTDETHRTGRLEGKPDIDTRVLREAVERHFQGAWHEWIGQSSNNQDLS